jgi:hypothetical protein
LGERARRRARRDREVHRRAAREGAGFLLSEHPHLDPDARPSLRWVRRGGAGAVDWKTYRQTYAGRLVAENAKIKLLRESLDTLAVSRAFSKDWETPLDEHAVEGVPKGLPDGTRILLFRACFGANPVNGVFVTDTSDSYRTKITDGFGPDWNPVAN